MPEAVRQHGAGDSRLLRKVSNRQIMGDGTLCAYSAKVQVLIL